MTAAVEVRRLYRSQAVVWLGAQFPSASVEVVNQALEFAKTDPPVPPEGARVIKYTILRNEGDFIAAAYLLGASLTTLSLLTQTTRSNIYNHVRRRLSMEERSKRNTKMLNYEQVQLLHQIFQRHMRESSSVFNGLTMSQAAELLAIELRFIDERATAEGG